MSNIYHAKLNINERIFEVYKEVVGIEDLLRNLFKKVSSDIEVKMIDYSYHFADLSFDEKKLVIYGRLAKVFRDKELNIFDSKEKRIHTSNVNNATDYVAFAFDVMQEIIYFCPVKSFGRKEFIEVFAELIEKSYEDIGYVKINLLLEQQKFEDSFSKIEKLRNFSAIIIPPNAGSDDIFFKKRLIKISDD